MQDHNWYAVRVTGGALKVFSEKLVFAGPKGGTRKFSVPDIDQRTNIEVEFEKLGIEYFLPCLISKKQHRRKREAYITKRRPLIPGYVFVRYVSDWQQIKDIRDVVDVVRSENGPVRIRNQDIHLLRMAAWQSYCDAFESEHERLKRKFPAGSTHRVNHKTVGFIDVTVLSVTQSKKIKGFSDWLGKVEFKAEDLLQA
jgi:transcription antitermination factor NusG